MEELKRHMKQLEVEFEQWFAGALPRPPVETRRRVDDIIRRYNVRPPQNLTEASVFQMHQAKYNTYSEMWNRRTRLKEEGRLPGGSEARTPAAAYPQPAPAGSAAPPDKLRQVFEEFLAAKRQAGEPAAAIPYETFRERLSQQADQLRTKGGYRDVDFGVSLKDGKVSIVARPKR
jgi:hypothetical protein